MSLLHIKHVPQSINTLGWLLIMLVHHINCAANILHMHVRIYILNHLPAYKVNLHCEIHMDICREPITKHLTLHLYSPSLMGWKSCKEKIIQSFQHHTATEVKVYKKRREPTLCMVICPEHNRALTLSPHTTEIIVNVSGSSDEVHRTP